MGYVPLVGGLHRQWSQDEGLPQNSAGVLAQGADGHLFVGTQAGLARFDGRTWTVLDQAAGMPCEFIIALASAPDADDFIWSVYEDREGAVWMGTSAGTLHRWKDGTLAASYTAADGLPGGAISDILQDREGALWLATKGGQCASTRAASRCSPLYEDRQGSLWFGTRGGLARRREGQWRVFTTKDGLADDFITTLLEAPGGGLWLGSDFGLNFLDDSGVRRDGPEQALAGRRVQGLLLPQAGAKPEPEEESPSFPLPHHPRPLLLPLRRQRRGRGAQGSRGAR